tara:strand:+ start:267 stop:890 length:624 start_codon:yes stop_codon:yes gene_type:complete
MFNDKYSILDFENFIKDIDLDIIVETGTKVGESTIKFKKYCKFVHTIELIESLSRTAQKKFNEHWSTDKDNCRFWIGDTRDKLKEILKTITKNQNVLFFLDAHSHIWHLEGIPQGNNNPILDELSTLVRFVNDEKIKKPYIIIDDFANPKNKNIKHNIYKDSTLNIAYVKKHLDSIYKKNGYKVYYTEKVEKSSNSGKIFIKPKEVI